MERRAFIKSSCLACAGGIISSLLVQSCSTNKYVSNYSVNQNKITLKKTEFTVVYKDKTLQKKFILIQPQGLQFPIALYQVKESEYKALLLQCSHQSCELNAFETAMVCPCHGSEFNINGNVTQGPAENALQTFITTHDNENIYIQL